MRNPSKKTTQILSGDKITIIELVIKNAISNLSFPKSFNLNFFQTVEKNLRKLLVKKSYFAWRKRIKHNKLESFCFRETLYCCINFCSYKRDCGWNECTLFLSTRIKKERFISH